MFDILVICYLFLGGAGAGCLFLASVGSLAFHASSDRTCGQSLGFRRVRRRWFLVGLCALTFSVLCLAADLGRIDRIIYLFVRPRLSYIAFGTYALFATWLCALFLVCASWFESPRVGSGARKAGEVLCAVGSASVMAYTGLYLWSLKAVALWDTPLLPMLFVLSALSCGAAALGLCSFWSDGEGVPGRVAVWAQCAHVVLPICEGVVLVVWLAWALFDSRASEAARLLVAGPLCTWLWAGAVICGVAAPLVVAVLPGKANPLPLALSELLVLVGGFSLRYCTVCAGLH